jgi:hypothetical protein
VCDLLFRGHESHLRAPLRALLIARMCTSVDARMQHSRHLNRVNENNAAGALAPDDALHHEIGEEGTRE